MTPLPKSDVIKKKGTKGGEGRGRKNRRGSCQPPRCMGAARLGEQSGDDKRVTCLSSERDLRKAKTRHKGGNKGGEKQGKKNATHGKREMDSDQERQPIRLRQAGVFNFKIAKKGPPKGRLRSRERRDSGGRLRRMNPQRGIRGPGARKNNPKDVKQGNVKKASPIQRRTKKKLP